MLKKSKFNKILWDKQELIIYNSLSGKIYKTSNLNLANNIENILCNNENTKNKKLIEFLKNNNFIVDDVYNEIVTANSVKLDKQYDKLLHLIILPTEQCNFRCKYCYEDFKIGNMSKEKQDAIILFLRKNIKNYTAISLDWFGGEPLLAMDAIEYISKHALEICRIAKKPLISSMTTNGYFLDCATFEKLSAYNLIDIQITIDGLKQTHDMQRVLKDGSPTFDKIINNLIEIKHHANTKFCKIYIRTNVTWDVFQSIDEIIDYFYELFGEDNRFVFYFRPVTNLGGNAIQNISEKIMSYNDFSQVYDKLIKNKKLNIGLYDRAFTPGGSICQASLKNLFIIRSDGRINKCSDYLEWPENQIGYLTDNGDMKINQEMQAKWICSSTDQNCFDCTYYGSCFNIGCPAKKIKETSRTCGYEKIFQNETLLLLNAYGKIPEILEVI